MRIRKRVFIPICIVLALLLLIFGTLWYMEAHTLGLSVGRVLKSGSSTMLILDNSPIVMSNRTDSEKLFDKLTDGDKVLVLHDGIAESYPGKTGAHGVIKLSDGKIDDIPPEVIASLSELGWRTDFVLEIPEEIPDDFSFALTWGTYGISSYDSKSGKLVKTTDATNPDEYITSCMLSEEQMEEIYRMIRDLDISSYPETYDPINDPNSELQTMSSPSMTLILTVRRGDGSKTVACRNIAMQFKGYDEKSQRFLDVCRAIKETMTATEEWKALPEYEVFYE